MQITSAVFVKAIVEEDEELERDFPQIAFIGRSNVGKSSIINALTRQKNLARVSSFPGRTAQIILFLINKSFFLVDLPGYGFAKASREKREQFQKLIDWYLFESGYEQKKVVLIIDANVGVTDSDIAMLENLERHGKHIVVIANKIDKIKKSVYAERMKNIQDIVAGHTIVPCSTKTKAGMSALINEIFAK